MDHQVDLGREAEVLLPLVRPPGMPDEKFAADTD